MCDFELGWQGVGVQGTSGLIPGKAPFFFRCQYQLRLTEARIETKELGLSKPKYKFERNSGLSLLHA